MRKPDGGFTLIEVLIAITILATSIISMFAIYTHCILELRRARNRTIATNCAQQMLDMVLSLPDDVFGWNGVRTTAEALNNPLIRADVQAWQAALQTMLPGAGGELAVADDSDYTTRVSVTINYWNYKRFMKTTLSVNIPRSFPLQEQSVP
jgi:prepilin-type N-terminal cleavage/methylation domain-containing protein